MKLRLMSLNIQRFLICKAVFSETADSTWSVRLSFLGFSLLTTQKELNELGKKLFVAWSRCGCTRAGSINLICIWPTQKQNTINNKKLINLIIIVQEHIFSITERGCEDQRIC
jgi:hypothetical protein